MKTALLLVDIQNDYFDGGKKALAGSASAAAQAALALALFREKDMPVIHIQHISVNQGAGFFLPDTPGALIHESVKPLQTEPVFVKHFPNSFRGTGLEEYLKKHDIKCLVAAGMMTQMCIDTTVRAAFDLGFECLLAADACAASDLKYKERFIPAEQVHAAFCAALGARFAKLVSVNELSEVISR